MIDDKWLESIKVGDTVIIPNDSYHGGDRIVKVIKLTKTQVHITGGSYTQKFNRYTGRSIGTGTWHTSYIKEAIPEVVQKIQEIRLQSKLRNAVEKSVNTFTLDQLRQIVEICKIKI